MLPRVKQRQEKLKAICAQKPFSSLSEDEQAAFVEEKQKLSALAYQAYEMIKDEPEAALEAVEYWALARVMENGSSGNELIAKSVNQSPLAIALDVTEAPEICFKKGICYLVGIGD